MLTGGSSCQIDVMSAIPETQAKLLSNKTMRVPGPGHPRYVVGLDVFHQLHCLVSISKRSRV